MEQYCLAEDLIARDAERSFFDRKGFRVLRFNPSGFAVLRRKLGTRFDYAEFARACDEEGVSTRDARNFWQKCVDYGVVVSV